MSDYLLDFLSTFTGINCWYLHIFIHPSTVSSFPQQYLICRLKGIIPVTLNGKTGEWSPDPARSNKRGFFLPWSGLKDQLCRAWRRYRSESRVEEVQLRFRPVLQLELSVCRSPSCVTHTSCFLQIIQCQIKILNLNFQITFIKQVKSKLGSNLGKHCFF